MRCRWVLALVCGCDYTFQLDRIALPSDGGAGSCAPASPRDDFAPAPETCPWGYATIEGTATALRVNGELVVNPGSTNGSRAGCYKDNYDLSVGAFVQVLQPATGTGGAYTQLKVFFAAETAGIEHYSYDGNLRFTIDDAEVPGTIQAFDPKAASWWRLRREGQTIFGELSGDAVTWRPYAQRTVTVSTLPTMGFGAGNSDPGTTMNARFDNFNVCP